MIYYVAVRPGERKDMSSLKNYVSKERIVRAFKEGQFVRRVIRTLLIIGRRYKNKALYEAKYFLNKTVWDKKLQSMPIDENKIVFCSCQGNYSDNPKYILEEIIRRGLDLNIVWLSDEKALDDIGQFPSAVKRVVSWETRKAYEELYTAKIIVLNSVELFYKPFDKKEGQVIIQTWHGSFGIKRFDREVNKGVEWCDAGDRSAAVTDFVISNSDFEDGIYRMSFWKSNEILKYGHPRSDIILNASETERAELKKKIFDSVGYEYSGEKIFLYGPTFRDPPRFDCYDLDAKRVKAALEKRFGGSWVALYRYHPNLRGSGAINLDGVIDITDYVDMQELIAITDVAISDYSSWICDFTLTGKPGFLYATDVDDYSMERGLAFPLDVTPFPIATNNDEMVKNIEIFDLEKYECDREQFLKDRGSYEDGHAAERTVDKIIELLK